MNSNGRSAHVNAKPKPILLHWQAARVQSDRRAGDSPRRTGKQGSRAAQAQPHLHASLGSTPVLIEIQHHDRATVPRRTHKPIFWMRAPVRQARNTQVSRHRHGPTIRKVKQVASNVAKVSLRGAILLKLAWFHTPRRFVLYVCINALLPLRRTTSESGDKRLNGAPRDMAKLGLALN
jgi:hypothetical protein